MKELYNISAQVGFYTDKQRRNKGIYRQVGKIVEINGIKYLKMDKFFNLSAVHSRNAGDSQVFLSLFPVEEKKEQEHAPLETFTDDEIPW